jgi:hypothetical protein
MPTLTHPTAKTLTDALTATITATNARKSPGRRLSASTVTPRVVAMVLAKDAGSFDVHGGTQANSYPARTTALAVAWFTRLDGVKVVRIRCRLRNLTSVNSEVRPPYKRNYFPADWMVNHSPVKGYVLLASEELAEAFNHVREMPDDVCQTVAENPDDLTAWAVLADYLDELADVLTDDARAEVAARAARIRSLVGVVAYAKK